MDDLDEARARLTQLAEDLTGFCRKEGAGGRAEADCVAASTLRLASPRLRRRHRVELKLERLPPLGIDPMSLEQVLLNLLVNAVDATPQGGLIRLSARLRQDCALFAVQDDGPGIPEELHGSLFAPFVTTKAPGVGTGLGLFISRRLAEGAGGALRLAPSEFGARFELSVPLAAEVCAVPEGHWSRLEGLLAEGGDHG